MRFLKIVTIKKLLGVNFNNRLGFDSHVTNMCNRVIKKLYALTKVWQFMGIHKRRMTMKTFLLQNLVTTHWYGCSVVEN